MGRFFHNYRKFFLCGCAPDVEQAKDWRKKGGQKSASMDYKDYKDIVFMRREQRQLKFPGSKW